MSQTIFEHVLIPVDLSQRTEAALAWLVRVAGPGTRATLLHVIETLEDVPFSEMEGFYRKLEDRAVETLDGWIDDLARRGISAERRVVFGHRLHDILAAAADDEPDVMVLRSHTVDPVRPGHGWGTLSHRLAVLAPCPVLLVK